jgi:hypothetical protein
MRPRRSIWLAAYASEPHSPPAGIGWAATCGARKDETFVPLRGTLTMYLGDSPERHEVSVGGLVHVEAGTALQIVNEGDQELVVIPEHWPGERLTLQIARLDCRRGAKQERGANAYWDSLMPEQEAWVLKKMRLAEFGERSARRKKAISYREDGILWIGRSGQHLPSGVPPPV